MTVAELQFLMPATRHTGAAYAISQSHCSVPPVLHCVQARRKRFACSGPLPTEPATWGMQGRSGPRCKAPQSAPVLPGSV
jgi:hypothetical protein